MDEAPQSVASRPCHKPRVLRLFRKLTSHIPPGQLARYVLVGVWNTLFGYSSYALLTAILQPRISQGYVLAGFLAGVLNITVAFLGYKWFVFKTKGHYAREWARCIAVYGSNIILGTALLPLVVQALRFGFGPKPSDPYVAGALLTVLGVLLSFLGHKHFSFAKPNH